MCNLSDIYVTGINFYKLLISFLMITVWQDKKYKNVTRMEEQVLEGMAYLKAAKRCANINCSGWIRVWSKSLCDYPPLRFFFRFMLIRHGFQAFFIVSVKDANLLVYAYVITYWELHRFQESQLCHFGTKPVTTLHNFRLNSTRRYLLSEPDNLIYHRNVIV